MVSFFEIEMLGNLSDQYSRMVKKAPKKMQKNMQVIADSLAHVKEVLIDEGLVSESEGWNLGRSLDNEINMERAGN